MAVAGDTIFVGAYGDDDDGTNSGSVYVFRTTTAPPTTRWRRSRPRAPRRRDRQPAADGDTLASGPQRQLLQRGSARKSGSTYAQVARLTGSGVASDDEFGTSVDVSGDTIVVGTEYTGAAFVYRTSDGGATWAAVTTLEGSDSFGESVAIDGDTIVIGAYGEAYVYRTSDGGATYAEVVKLTAPEGSDSFGEAVAVSGGAVSVAAYGATYSRRGGAAPARRAARRRL